MKLSAIYHRLAPVVRRNARIIAGSSAATAGIDRALSYLTTNPESLLVTVPAGLFLGFVIGLIREQIQPAAALQVIPFEPSMLEQEYESLQKLISDRESSETKIAQMEDLLKRVEGAERINLNHALRSLRSNLDGVNNNIILSESQLVLGAPVHRVASLGEGGMASVFIGYSEGLRKGVVVKVVRRDVLTDRQYGEFIKRLEREAVTQSKINHPNIVRVYTFKEVEGEPAVIQELVKGEDLRVTMKELVSFREDEQLYINIMLQIAEGLKAAHGEDIIHRDLKPENILVTRNKRGQIDLVKLIDFGLARDIVSGQKRFTHLTAGVAAGTPGYMSPEQWKNAAMAGKPTDIYALGCIFFELISGQIPYINQLPTSADFEQVREHFTRMPVPDLPVGTSLQLQALIKKMMEKKPTDRPDIDVVISELKKFSPADMDSAETQVIVMRRTEIDREEK